MPLVRRADGPAHGLPEVCTVTGVGIQSCRRGVSWWAPAPVARSDEPESLPNWPAAAGDCFRRRQRRKRRARCRVNRISTVCQRCRCQSIVYHLLRLRARPTRTVRMPIISVTISCATLYWVVTTWLVGSNQPRAVAGARTVALCQWYISVSHHRTVIKAGAPSRRDRSQRRGESVNRRHHGHSTRHAHYEYRRATAALSPCL